MKGRQTIITTQSINLSKTATIFQAEAAAIEKVANHMNENFDSSYKYLKIFSDSQAVIKALEKPDITSHTILGARKALNQLKSKVITLSVIWIKAHNGFTGNELADKYAKLGTIDTSNHMITQTTKQEIKNIIETKSNEYWCRKWERYKHCRQTKNFYPGPSTALYKKVSKLSRSALSTLIQVVTGQNNLNYLLSKILPNHTDQCRFCEENEETFIHLLNDCPVFLEFRQAHLNGSVVVDTVDWDPRVLLQFAYHPQIAEALNERYTTTR